jgi:hypothetical protein
MFARALMTTHEVSALLGRPTPRSEAAEMQERLQAIRRELQTVTAACETVSHEYRGIQRRVSIEICRTLASEHRAFYDPNDAGSEYHLFDDAVERIMPGAFDRAVREDDVVSLFNHDSNFVLGRTAAGTLKLTIDSRGLRFDIAAPQTQAMQDFVVAPIQRGDVTGSSFMFIPTDVRWVEANGLAIREIHDIKLFEVGPMTFLAYESTTADAEGKSRKRKTGGRSASSGNDDRRRAMARRMEYVDKTERDGRRRAAIARRMQYVDKMERDSGPVL